MQKRLTLWLNSKNQVSEALLDMSINFQHLSIKHNTLSILYTFLRKCFWNASLHEVRWVLVRWQSVDWGFHIDSFFSTISGFETQNLRTMPQLVPRCSNSKFSSFHFFWRNIKMVKSFVCQLYPSFQELVKTRFFSYALIYNTTQVMYFEGIYVFTWLYFTKYKNECETIAENAFMFSHSCTVLYFLVIAVPILKYILTTPGL